MEFYIGQILLGAWSFIPDGLAICQGQLLLINQNPALYSLIGGTFGGDSQTNFGLPDLRGRSAIGLGSLPTGEIFERGQHGGAATVTLTMGNLPIHDHEYSLSGGLYTGKVNSSVDPANNFLGESIPTNPIYRTYKSDDLAVLNGLQGMQFTMENAGKSEAFSIENPYLALNYFMALGGIYPMRS